MRIVYMGTPDFAIPPLKRLVADGHEILGVFTRPDKPKGRGKKLLPTPVKEYALTENIPVYQPAGFKSGEALRILEELGPQLIVVVAYGRILPESVLNLPPYGCINVHASLLPKYRGAAPIQWSIIRGERQTGVSTMFMAQGLDEGDVIYQEKTEISPRETGETLYRRLSQMGAELLSRTVRGMALGTAPRVPQNGAEATFAPPITKEDTLLDWTRPARELLNLMHGADPKPGAWAALEGQLFRFFDGEVTSCAGLPGQVLRAGPKEGLLIACGAGTGLEITCLQAQGGRRMGAKDYLRGHEILPGVCFSGK